MKRRWAIGAAGVVSLAAVVAPAQATPPAHFLKEVYTPDVTVLDQGLTDTCGFDVYATSKGKFRLTAFFDKDGQITEFQGHPSTATTFSSEWASLETSDRGLDKYILQDDGNLLIFGTGIHLKVKGEEYAIGLWRLTIDLATGEMVSAEYSGNFDLENEEIDAYLCSALGGP
jgi:hypothetical protein